MTRAWETLARVASETERGDLELRRRGDDEFLILLAGRVLMNSRASRSEIALAELACAALPAETIAPRVLIGGLGMGRTLRAALDALPADATLVVAELNACVVEWCRGPLAALSGDALADPRVSVQLGDVARLIDGAGRAEAERYDAIVLDLFEGPSEPAAGRSRHRSRPREDPFFGAKALARTRKALRPGGVFALWAEARQPHFESRLRTAGFAFDHHRPGRGGLRHAVYVAR